jgi:hypothetical protein
MMKSHAVVVLLALACTSTTNEPGLSAGGNAGTPSNSGGNSNGAGGRTAAGSGGAPLGGVAGTDETGGLAGIGGSAGSGESGGGSGGSPNAGAANAGAANAGAANAGSGGDGSAGTTGGGSGGRAGNAGSGAGTAGGGAGGSAPAGCDWANPDGRITLFDGTTLTGWQNSTTGGAAEWRLVGDGSMEIVPMNPSTNIQTTMKFEDLCLHLEYLTPMYPANVTGQQRGNSGIYVKRSYEMQVLDSYGQPPAIDGCGAVYNISPPLVVACNMQLVWNTYEIEFKASRWDASGAKIENAVFVAATLNGVLVQRDVELDVSSTTAGQPDARGPQALMLQDHGNAVLFRNIWAKIPRY